LNRNQDAVDPLQKVAQDCEQTILQFVPQPVEHPEPQFPVHVPEQVEHPPELDPVHPPEHVPLQLPEQLLQPDDALVPVQSFAQPSQVVLSGLLQSVNEIPKPINAMKGKDNFTAVLKKSRLFWTPLNFNFSIFYCLNI
jgi:hypothetical protein